MKKFAVSLVIVLFSFLYGPASALDFDDLLFYADFNESPEAAFAVGPQELYEPGEEKGEPERGARRSARTTKRPAWAPPEGVELPEISPEGAPWAIPSVPGGPQGMGLRSGGGISFEEGLFDSAVLVGGYAEDVPLLSYAVSRNFYSYNGTVCFWARPADWSGGDGRSHILFNIESRNERTLLEVDPSGRTTLRWISDKDERQISSWKLRWSADSWHHVAISWMRGEMKLFIDGEMISFLNAPRVQMPPRATHFSLGWGGASSTLFDELMVFARPLSDEEIRFIYDKRSRKMEAPQLAVPVASSVLLLDGGLKRYEYKNAAVVSGFFDDILGLPIKDDTKVYVTHDNENLYFAFVCPLAVRPSSGYRKRVETPPSRQRSLRRRTAQRRPAPVRREETKKENDSVFILIKTARGAGVRDFLVDVNGKIQTRDENGKEWRSGAAAKVKMMGHSRWIAEIVIPLSDLGIYSTSEDSVIYANFGRKWRSGKQLTGLWFFNPVDSAAAGAIRLKAECAVVAVDSLGDPGSGDFEVRLSIANQTDTRRKLVVSFEDGRALFKDAKSINIEAGGEIEYEYKKKIERSVSSELLMRINEVGDTRALYQTVIPYVVAPKALAAVKIQDRAAKLEVSLVNVVEKGASREAYSADVSITSKGSSKVLATKKITDIAREAKLAVFDLEDLPPGEYLCRSVFYLDGTAIAEYEKPFEREKPPEWLENKIGLTGKVYEPWTPMDWDGEKITMCGRSYSFKDTLFPARLVSQNGDILAGPMRMVLTSDGQSTVVEGGKVSITRKTDEKVEFRNEFSNAKVSVVADGFVEYDGLCWINIKIGPKYGPVQISRLAFEVHLNRQEMRLFDAGALDGTGTGAIPLKGWSGPAHSIWAGNAERGIQFIFKSTKNWISSDQNKQIGLHAKDSGTNLEFNFIDFPTSLSEPVEFELGFVVTPVKPLRRDSRNWRFYLSEARKAKEEEKKPSRLMPVSKPKPEAPRPGAGMPSADEIRMTQLRMKVQSGQQLTPDEVREMTLLQKGPAMTPGERRELNEIQRRTMEGGGFLPPGMRPPAEAEAPGAPGPEPGKPIIVKERRKREIPIPDNIVTLELGWTDWSRIFNFPEPAEGAADLIKERKKEKKLLFPYISANLVSPVLPQFADFEQQWQVIPQQYHESIRQPAGEITALVCPRSSFADFFIWKMQSAISQLDPAGILIDNAVPLPCSNELHHCGYLQEGHRREELPVLALRRFQKRVFALMKENNEDSLVACNVMGSPNLACAAFSDLIVNGCQNDRIRESLAAAGKRDNYYDILPLARFRALYCGSRPGIPVVLYDGYTPQTRQQRGKFAVRSRSRRQADDVTASDTHLVGLLLAHNTPLWYARLEEDDPVLRYIKCVRDIMAWDENVEFYPYWSSSKPVSMNVERDDLVVSSLYRRKDAVLLVLFNNTDADLNATVKVNFEELGLKELADAPALDVLALSTPQGRKGRARGAVEGAPDWSELVYRGLSKPSFVFKGGRTQLTLPARTPKVLFLWGEGEEVETGPE